MAAIEVRECRTRRDHGEVRGRQARQRAVHVGGRRAARQVAQRDREVDDLARIGIAVEVAAALTAKRSTESAGNGVQARPTETLAVIFSPLALIPVTRTPVNDPSWRARRVR